jgi:hypothetical protein
VAKRIANTTQGPIGSESHVGWGKYADGGTWRLFQAGHQPEGEEPDFYQDARQARGAFLSWASRHGYTVRAPLIFELDEDGYPTDECYSFEITARKRAPVKAAG